MSAKILIIVVAVGALLAVLWASSKTSTSEIVVNANTPQKQLTPTQTIAQTLASPNALTGIFSGFSGLLSGFSNPSPVSPTNSTSAVNLPITSGNSALSSVYSTTGNPSMPSTNGSPSTVLPLTNIDQTQLSSLPPGVDYPGISTDGDVGTDNIDVTYDD
jgi:hypothetical protein